MKRLTTIIAVMAIFSLSVMAQTPAQPKGQSVALKVLVEDFAEPFPATAKSHVENKVTMLLTQNGIASMDYLGQFFITVKKVRSSFPCSSRLVVS